MRERSNDPTYPHAKFLKDCLEENVIVPVGLVVKLLDERIDEGAKEGKRWVLVRGFPDTMQQLYEFEEKVSASPVNRIKLTTTGAKGKLHTTSELLSSGNTPTWRTLFE